MHLVVQSATVEIIPLKLNFNKKIKFDITLGHMYTCSVCVLGKHWETLVISTKDPPILPAINAM